MHKYLKIGLTMLPILGSVGGMGVYLATKMNVSSENLDNEPNKKSGPIANLGHPHKHVGQSAVNEQAGANGQIHSQSGGVNGVPNIAPGVIEYIPAHEMHTPKKVPIFTPNLMTPTEIRASYKNIKVFPNIQVSEIYKYIRIDFRLISLDLKIVSYVVGTAVKKAQISDGTISFGYQYLSQEKIELAISLFWSDINGNVRKIKTYNIKLERLRS